MVVDDALEYYKGEFVSGLAGSSCVKYHCFVSTDSLSEPAAHIQSLYDNIGTPALPFSSQKIVVLQWQMLWYSHVYFFCLHWNNTKKSEKKCQIWLDSTQNSKNGLDKMIGTLKLIFGSIPFGKNNWNQSLSVTMNECLTTLYWNFGPLFFFQLLQVSHIWRVPSLNCCFEIMPQVCYGIKIWTHLGHFRTIQCFVSTLLYFGLICPQDVLSEWFWLPQESFGKLQSGFFMSLCQQWGPPRSPTIASHFIQKATDSASWHCCTLCLQGSLNLFWSCSRFFIHHSNNPLLHSVINFSLPSTSREVSDNAMGCKLLDDTAHSGHRNIKISGDGLVALKLSKLFYNFGSQILI